MNMERASLTEDFEGNVNYQGTCRRRLWKRVSSLRRGPIRVPGEGGSVYWVVSEIVERGLRKWSISVCGNSIWGTWRGSFTRDPEEYVGESSGDAHLSPWEPRWGARKGPCLPGTYVLKKALKTGISFHRGPVENLGGGGSVFREL